MQSHKGDTSGKLEETERNLHEGAPRAPIYTYYGGSTLFYALGRATQALPLRPGLACTPGQAFCTACWDHWTGGASVVGLWLHC
jgi:hypothetical protein